MKLRSQLTHSHLRSVRTTVLSAADYSVLSRVVHVLNLSTQGRPIDNPLDVWAPRLRQNVIDDYSLPRPLGPRIKIVIKEVEAAAKARLQLATGIDVGLLHTDDGLTQLIGLADKQCRIARDRFCLLMAAEYKALDQAGYNTQSALLPDPWLRRLGRIQVVRMDGIQRGDHAPDLGAALLTLDAAKSSLGYSPELLNSGNQNLA